MNSFIRPSEIPGISQLDNVSILSKSPSETEEIAAHFAGRKDIPGVLALYGGLGVGKTAFVRGLAAGLNIKQPVSSPTFAIVHEYEGDFSRLIHFDMYRVENWGDLETTGFYDYLDQADQAASPLGRQSKKTFIVAEWSENIESALPKSCWKIKIDKLNDGETFSENHRVITINIL